MSNELYQEWLDIAEMDLASAEYLTKMIPTPLEIICYHCEQAAEKLLKAVLAFNDMEPPRTHDLVQLIKQCATIVPEFEALADACIELSPYGVQVRYPAHMDILESDMECAKRECRKVDAFVRGYIEEALEIAEGPTMQM